MELSLEVFRHVPHLRDRILHPGQSRFRKLDYNMIDANAREAGLGENWRRTHEEREETRVAALKNRAGKDVWIFAYGSLMWDPGFVFEEVRMANVAGYSRKFCLVTEIGRGSPQMPGLMAALDHGGSCQGLVFRITADAVETETRIIWEREMITWGYVPTFVSAQTDDGTIEALTFVANPDGDRYKPNASPDEAAQMIVTGSGFLGRNIDYLENLNAQLELLGLHDEDCVDLQRRARKLIASYPPSDAL